MRTRKVTNLCATKFTAAGSTMWESALRKTSQAPVSAESIRIEPVRRGTSSSAMNS